MDFKNRVFHKVVSFIDTRHQSHTFQLFGHMLEVPPGVIDSTKQITFNNNLLKIETIIDFWLTNETSEISSANFKRAVRIAMDNHSANQITYNMIESCKDENQEVKIDDTLQLPLVFRALSDFNSNWLEIAFGLKVPLNFQNEMIRSNRIPTEMLEKCMIYWRDNATSDYTLDNLMKSVPFDEMKIALNTLSLQTDNSTSIDASV